MKVNIYIESSIRAPARKQDGVVGFVLQAGDTDNTKTVFGAVTDVTKNYADLLCLKNALSRLNPHADSLLIHTSSIYVNQSLLAMSENSGFEGFEKTKDGKPRKHIDEWREVYKVLSTRPYEVVFNQPNEFRNWLQQDCERRAKKHG